MVVFLTVCTKNRKSWLARTDAHELLRSIWVNARDWGVGPYILMPDHLHLFASPGLLTRSFDRWITLWKARFTIRFSKERFGWQQSAFHHRIRTYEDREAKLKYIQQNAVRAGLVKDIGDWPYQGEISPSGYWW
jgi:putative transposase